MNPRKAMKALPPPPMRNAPIEPAWTTLAQTLLLVMIAMLA